jgi:hypothetical protein
MRTILTRIPLTAVACVAGLFLLLAGPVSSQTVVKPRPAPPGSWTLIGTTVADYSADHDAIIVTGRYDNFRKIMFTVSSAPLNMHRLLVTYDNGEPEEIHVKQKIKKGGQSREIDLHGAGTRNIHRIDFWYDTRGTHERAEVTVFGQK